MAEATEPGEVCISSEEAEVLENSPNVVDSGSAAGQRGSLRGYQADADNDVVVINTVGHGEFVAGPLGERQGKALARRGRTGQCRRGNVPLETGFRGSAKLGGRGGSGGANVTTLRNGEVGRLGHGCRLAV